MGYFNFPKLNSIPMKTDSSIFLSHLQPARPKKPNQQHTNNRESRTHSHLLNNRFILGPGSPDAPEPRFSCFTSLNDFGVKGAESPIPGNPALPHPCKPWRSATRPCQRLFSINYYTFFQIERANTKSF